MYYPQGASYPFKAYHAPLQKNHQLVSLDQFSVVFGKLMPLVSFHKAVIYEPIKRNTTSISLLTFSLLFKSVRQHYSVSGRRLRESCV